MVIVGLTVTINEPMLPGCQLTLSPPVAVSTTGRPGHTVVELAIMPGFGEGLTVTFSVRVVAHPAALVPVTVYVVFIPGLTVTCDPVWLPGIHE